MASPAFAFQHVTKRFGPITANDDITFSVALASIHGIVGENGAGKSTLMKILYGLYQPDEGRLEIRGEPVKIRDPQDAIHRGIGMVHQHFMLVPPLAVWQNVILGAEPSFGLSKKTALATLTALCRDFGFELDLEAPVESLCVGEQQQVEILKLLYRKADILILDEPTAVLTPQEVDKLFERLKQLWSGGKTIVLISHKLREILAFTQWVTVLRHGKIVETVPTNILTPVSLAEKIIGRKMRELPARKPCAGGDPVIEVRELRTPQPGRAALKGISFQVKPGEILGVAGIEGNGQASLLECLAGVDRNYEGAIHHGGNRPAFIPADRHREAVLLGLPLWENFLLGHHHEARFANHGMLSRKRTVEVATPFAKAFQVEPWNPDLPVSALSGGNQQKLVLARELSIDTACVIAAHPTRGVDVGAIELIHRVLLKLRDEGKGVLLVSSELDEILALCDRILVLFEGAISGETSRKDATETQLGLWMTGGKA